MYILKQICISQLHDRTVEIRIEDNGVGFSETLVQSFAEKTCSERSGLGFIIAKKFIEANGGNFSVSSRPNEGTTLSIRLQVAQC